MKTLKDLSRDEDGDIPIILLQCGHAFTMATLDGLFSIDTFYARDANMRWKSAVSVKMLMESGKGPFAGEHKPIHSCILCKVPITHIRRYRRVINIFQAVSLQRKWIVASETRASAWSKQVQNMSERQEEVSISDGGMDLRVKTTQLFKDLNNLYRIVEKARSSFLISPIQIVYQLEEAAKKRDTPHQYSQDVCDVMKSSKVPHIAFETVVLRVSILRARIACYTSAEHLRMMQNKKKKKDETKVSLVEAQLTDVDKFKKTMFETYRELTKVCREGKYRKRERNCHQTFALGLLLLEEDLRGVDAPKTTKVVSAKYQQLSCIDTVICMVPFVEGIRLEDLERLRERVLGNFYQADQERKMIFKAMAPDVGERMTKYGGHWFECPQGHPYTIGECGGATQESKCPECGASVGGSRHGLARGNRAAAGFNKFATRFR